MLDIAKINKLWVNVSTLFVHLTHIFFIKLIFNFGNNFTVDNPVFICNMMSIINGYKMPTIVISSSSDR